MNTPTHTPGPWAWLQADIENGEGPILSSSKDDEIVLDMGWPEDGESMTVPNEIDRALIAAAPELLEALKRARCELDWFAKEHTCCPLTDGIMELIDAAVQKATTP